MREYKVWFKLVAVVLSVLIGFQVAPVFAVALENDQSTTATTKLQNPKASTVPAKNTVPEDVLFHLADTDDAEESSKEESPVITGEETALRDAGVKHFRLADGRFMAAIYPEPVHYLKGDEWVDIDNTLKVAKAEDGTTVYRTEETATPVSFPAKLSESPITMTVRGHELKMEALTEESSDSKAAASAKVMDPEKMVSAKLNDGEDASAAEISDSLAAVDNHDSALSYQNALPGGDLEYKVTSSQVKEAIVLKEKQEDYRYEFSFDAGDLEVLENGDGSVSLIENGDEEHPLFVFASPFMEDAKGEYSDEVFMAVEKADPEDDSSTLYNLIVKADPQWLNDASRQFPVVIDPTVLLDVGYLNIDDTYVDTASAVHHAWAASLYVGKNSLGTTRTYIKYALPDLPDCSVVVGSKLYLAQRDYDPGSGSKAYIAAYAPNASWTNTTLLWSNQPSYNTSTGAVDFTTFTAGTGSFNYTLDITRIAKQWYEQGQNYGVMLKSYNESTTRRSAFYSTNYTSAAMYPQVSVTYVNSTGLESYWNYETVDLGRSGTVSVNDYNGAMTYVAEDIDLSGNTMP
ncbi:MAG: DNRLRE domain-containing protein, partial [Clostridia bacterium]|nr:DNRLRE domain-containing protein [Clostridia bacterium]